MTDRQTNRRRTGRQTDGVKGKTKRAMGWQKYRKKKADREQTEWQKDSRRANLLI